MPDPLNPKLGNDGLYELISRQYPSLTPAEIYQLGLLAGYDLIPPASKASTSQEKNSIAFTPSRSGPA